MLETSYRGSDRDMMPTIQLTAAVAEGDRIYTYSTLSFPVLTFGEDDYTTTHHWPTKWEKIGTYLSQLHEYVFYFDNGEE